MAHLRLHAGGGDDAPPPSGGDDGAGEDHIFPVPQPGPRRQGAARLLGHGEGLPGHGRLVGGEPGGGEDPGVSGDQVSGLQTDEIPGDQLAGLHPAGPALPDDVGHGGGEVPEGLQRLLGVVLLGEGDDGVEEDDAQDDDGLHPVLAAPGPQREPRRPQQHQHHGVPELAQQPAQQPRPLSGLQFVAPIPLQPSPGLPGGKALRAAGPQLLQHLSGLHGVPRSHARPLFSKFCMDKYTTGLSAFFREEGRTIGDILGPRSA